MVSALTIKAVDDWDKQMNVPLASALNATIELTGRNGREACKMAMIYMARSARSATRQSPVRRRVERDRYGEYMGIERKGQVRKLHRWRVEQDGGDFKAARRIRNRGLAKRSWMWGLRGLNDADAGNAIPGVAETVEHVTDESCGFILTNRLGYIMDAAPADIERRAANAASNQIMAQAAKRMERDHGVVIARLHGKAIPGRSVTLRGAWEAAR